MRQEHGCRAQVRGQTRTEAAESSGYSTRESGEVREVHHPIVFFETGEAMFRRTPRNDERREIATEKNNIGRVVWKRADPGCGYADRGGRADRSGLQVAAVADPDRVRTD